MTRPTPLLLIAFLAACMPAAPEDAPSEGAGTTRLREPDVRYEPTPQRVVHQMLELARAGPAGVVYDPASGDARIPTTAARHYDERGVGIDIDPERIADAAANTTAADVTAKVKIRNEDPQLPAFRTPTVNTLLLSPTHT